MGHEVRRLDQLIARAQMRGREGAGREAAIVPGGRSELALHGAQIKFKPCPLGRYEQFAVAACPEACAAANDLRLTPHTIPPPAQQRRLSFSARRAGAAAG